MPTRRPPEPPREPKVRGWGVQWQRRGFPPLISTASDPRYDPQPGPGGDLWLRTHFIAAMNGRPTDFAVFFRQAVPAEYLAAQNDR